MNILFALLALLLCCIIVQSIHHKKDRQQHGNLNHHNLGDDSYHHGTTKYTNRWVIEVTDDNPDTAASISDELGFHYHGKVGSLQNLHVVEHKTLLSGLNRTSDHHHRLITGHHKVVHARQERSLSRRKRYDTSARKQDPMYKQQWFLKNNGKKHTLSYLFSVPYYGSYRGKTFFSVDHLPS